MAVCMFFCCVVLKLFWYWSDYVPILVRNLFLTRIEVILKYFENRPRFGKIIPFSLKEYVLISQKLDWGPFWGSQLRLRGSKCSLLHHNKQCYQRIVYIGLRDEARQRSKGKGCFGSNFFFNLPSLYLYRFTELNKLLFELDFGAA